MDESVGGWVRGSSFSRVVSRVVARVDGGSGSARSIDDVELCMGPCPHFRLAQVSSVRPLNIENPVRMMGNFAISATNATVAPSYTVRLRTAADTSVWPAF